MLNILAQAAEPAAETVTESSNIFIQMLEKGGLPALTVFICFTVLMAFLKNKAKQDKAMQEEREIARKSEHEQLERMTDAYETLVHKFVDLTQDSTKALAIMSERVGGCPFREGRVLDPVSGEEKTDE